MRDYDPESYEFKRMNYLPFVSVTNKDEARTIGKEGLFDVLMAAYKAGPDGVTAKRLAEDLEISVPSVYKHLESLTQLGALDARTARELRKMNAHPGRRPAGEEQEGKVGKTFYESCRAGKKILIGEPVFAQDFIDRFTEISETPEAKELLRDCARANIVLLEHFLPKMKKQAGTVWPTESVCPFCEVNHDAREFVRAIMLRSSVGFLQLSRRYEELMKKYKFCTENAKTGDVHGRIITK